jgi:hypothetical protein
MEFEENDGKIERRIFEIYFSVVFSEKLLLSRCLKRLSKERLLKKAKTFKTLFPQYKNFALYLGLAGLHVNITAEREAIKQGIAIIKQIGDTMMINDTCLKVL